MGSGQRPVVEHLVGGVEALHQLGEDVEVTLALGGLDHAKGLIAKLLPLLALGLAGRLGDFNDDGRRLAVVGFPCGQLGGGHVVGDGGAAGHWSGALMCELYPVGRAQCPRCRAR